MIDAGYAPYHPAAPTRLRFLKTAEETNGEYVLIELRIEPGGILDTGHVRPSHSETFEVIAGTMRGRVDGETLRARAGDIVVVAPGKERSCWNQGEDELVVRCEIR